MPENNKRYTHLLWDWNGTLLDDAWLCVEIMNAMLKKRGKPPLDLERYRSIFDFPVKDYYQQAGLDFSIESFEDLAAEFMLEYDRRSPDCRLQAEARDVLDRCRARGCNLYLLSASHQARLEKRVEACGLSGYFIRIAGIADYYASGKVDCGRQLVASLDVPRHNFLMIGDTVHDWEVAQAIGVDCVLFSGGHQSLATLQRCHIPVVSSLQEITALLA